MAKQNMPRPRTKTAEAPPERTLAYDFDKKNENTSDLENGLTGKPSPFTKWEGSPASGDSGIMLDEATPAKHDPAVDSAAYAEVTFVSRQGGESQSFR